MKLEKFNYSSGKRSRWFLYGFILAVVLMVLINLFFSQAKYLNTESVKIVEGNISYKPNELNIVAVNIENDNGEYVYSEDIPTSGYYLDDSKSYCEVKNIKDNSIKIEYTGSKLEVTDISKKGTRCYAYFNKTKSKICPSGATACETIMANINTIGERTVFNKELDIFTSGIMYRTEDNDGTSYYYVGNPTDNWVRFAGFYWRIIRINGNGSIRIIYERNINEWYSKNYDFGDVTNIGSSYYNYGFVSDASLGFMYGDINSTSFNDLFANNNSSLIKTYLENWYINNLKDDYSSFIDNTSGFCNDRTTYSCTNVKCKDATKKDNADNNYTFYGGYKRLVNNQPTLICPQNNDYFTVNNSNGNNSLTYSIGLISIDEYIFAGGFRNKNTNIYLNRSYPYFSMTPYISQSVDENKSMFTIEDNNFNGLDKYGHWPWKEYAVVPVINLRSDVTLTGAGTIDNPYVVS